MLKGMKKMARFWKLADPDHPGEFTYLDREKVVGLYRDADSDEPRADMGSDSTYNLTEEDFAALRAWAEGESEYPPRVESAGVAYAGGGWK
jgi:hypothetical protein